MTNNLPTLKNIWEFDVNNQAAINNNNTDSFQRTIFTIKDVLCNLKNNPWSVVLSSNSVNYTGDGDTNVLLPLQDLSGNNHTGTLVGIDASNITTDVPGGTYSSNSMTFDTSSEYVSFGNIFNFVPTNTFSFSFWFKKNGGSDTYAISKFSGSIGYNIQVLNTGVIQFWFAQDFTNRMEVESSTSGLDDNIWHHIAVTYDGSGNASGVSIYIDGSADTTNIVADNVGPSTTNSKSFNISSYNDGAIGHFGGKIDDVAVYDKELTSSEVATIYNSGAPNDLTVNGPSSNLLGYWGMGDDLIVSTPIDTWFTPSNVIWNNEGSNHSWIVLQHPTRSTQICFDANSTIARIASMFISFGGNFSGGSLTKRPNAIDELKAGVSQNWAGIDTGTFISYVHVWQTQDASKTRVLANLDNSEGFGIFMLFDELDTFTDDWESQEVALISMAGSSISCLTNDNIFDTNKIRYGTTTNLPEFYSTSNPIRFFGGPLKVPSNSTFSRSSTLFNDENSSENEYATVGNFYDFERNESFSISFWFRTRFSQTQIPVSKRDNTSPLRGWSIYQDATGKYYWILCSTSGSDFIQVNTANAYNDGNWHHMITTYDGTSSTNGMNIYVDGVLDTTGATGTLSNTIVDITPMQISGRDGGNLGFVGNIDDVAIFNKELDGYDVVDIYNNGIPRDERNFDDGYLVGYWLMGDTDDGYGITFPTIPDESGSGNNATCTNMESADVPYGDTPANPIIYTRLSTQITSIDSGVDAWLSQRQSVSNELDGFPRILDSNNDNHGTAINMETTDAINPSTPYASIVIPDLSVSNNPGIPTNMEDVDFSSTNTPGGDAAYSINLDGSSEYISVGDVEELNFEFDNPFSISAWFNTTDTSSRVICAKEVGSGNLEGYAIFISNGQAIVRLEGGGAVDNKIEFASVNTSFNDGNWHHLVMTYDGYSTLDGTELYIDNTLQSKTSTFDAASGSLQNNIAFQIGRRDTTALWKGQIAEVGVFSKELSSTEVSELYNSNSPIDLRNTTVASNLVGYWKMEPDWDAGVSTGALLFDGINEYVNVGIKQDLAFASSDAFSIAAWVRAEPNGGGTIISKMGSSTAFDGWDLYVANIIRFRVQDNAATSTDQLQVSSAVDLRDGKWHFVVVTKPTGTTVANNVELWVDGNKLITSIDSNTLNANIESNSHSIQIGANTNGSQYFDGTIDSLLVYDKQLTGSEIRTLYSSSTITQYSLASMDFDGIDDHIIVGDVTELKFDVGDAFSFSAWIKSRGSGSTQVIVSKRDNIGDQTGYEFGLSSTGTLFFELSDVVGTQLTNVVGKTKDLADGFWHHVVCTKGTSEAGSNINLYVDKVQINKNIVTDTFSSGGGTSFDTTADFQIGAKDGANNVFDGWIDDVAVYNKELTVTEIKTIYNLGNPNNLTSNGPTGSLIGYWLMGDGVTSFPIIPDISINGNDGYATNMTNSSILDDNSTIYSIIGAPQDYTTIGPTTNLISYWTLNGKQGSFSCNQLAIISDYGYRGFHAMLEDMWNAPEGVANTPGVTYPADGYRQFAQFSNILFPWTGDNTQPNFGGSTTSTSKYDLQLISAGFGSIGKVKYYQMVGIDSGNPTQPAYHSWIVTGSPDPTGAQAVGNNAPPFGGPLTNIIVSAEWIS